MNEEDKIGWHGEVVYTRDTWRAAGAKRPAVEHGMARLSGIGKVRFVVGPRVEQSVQTTVTRLFAFFVVPFALAQPGWLPSIILDRHRRQSGRLEKFPSPSIPA